MYDILNASIHECRIFWLYTNKAFDHVKALHISYITRIKAFKWYIIKDKLNTNTSIRMLQICWNIRISTHTYMSIDLYIDLYVFRYAHTYTKNCSTLIKITLDTWQQ
jgi:hypothetical protein